LVLTCHRTAGGGLPVATELNVTVAPAQTMRLVGFNTTTGQVFAAWLESASKADTAQA
jgi:hypothetical protein